MESTPPKFNSEFSPENRPKPNRKPDRLSTTIFQGRAVKLRGGNQWIILVLVLVIGGRDYITPNIEGNV